MTWCSFFNEKPCSYALRTGVFVLLLGSSISLLLALHLASNCADTAEDMASGLASDINVPTLTADVNFHQYSTTVTMTNIEAEIPENILDKVGSIEHQMPHFCFEIALSLFLVFTALFALVCANWRFTIVKYQQDKERRDAYTIDGYALLPMTV